ncbi:MAG: zf-HC2 domain-containing protein [Actinomycetota bacterium]|nr:zf-HC2 domain-containing protein [Actinomycetota bacterium]
MRPDLTCNSVRAELSARLDDGATTTSDEVDAHLRHCDGCRHFEATQHSVRRALRIEPVQPTPDVAPRVMQAISTPSRQDLRAFRIRIAAVAAIAAALVVLATTLPVLDSTPRVAAASEVTARAFSVARTLESYRATFQIQERGWHAAIPVRRLIAKVWYSAPESFRLRVRDLTEYPAGAWPPNDVDVIASPSRSWIREPYSCPPEALPGCAISAGVEERTLDDRQPFDGTTRIPSDIVVPLETLAASDAFSVMGTEEIGEHDALHVVLTYRQAFPLVDALQAGGSWTPLLPLDRVDLWLEQESWFPLAFEVTRPGVPQPLLEVTTRNFVQPRHLQARLFDAPVGGTIRYGGFAADRHPQSAGRYVPRYVAGLEPYRSGTTASGDRLVAFARGMSYLNVTNRRARPRPDLDEPAEVVQLREGSFGFYRPAGPGSGRTIDVFTKRTHLRLETNLRREQLLEVAASLPVAGVAPRTLRSNGKVIVRIEPNRLHIGFARQPTYLPAGYGSISALLSRDRRGADVTTVYLQSETALEGSEIRLFQSTRVSMLPPVSDNVVAVRVGGSAARWAPQRGELDWIGEDGTYRSLTAPSFDLTTVLRIAEGLG